MLNTRMLYILSMVLFLFFIIREYVAYKKYLTLKYFFTPSITMLFVIMMILSITVFGADRYRLMILFSLLMALVADTLLMIEEVNFLKNGMIFFIMAHIFYLCSFSDDATFKSWNLLLILILIVLNYIYYKQLIKTAGTMLPAILIYTLVLNLMVYFAVTRLNRGISVSGIFLAAGAVLFMISDFLLSVNAFIRPVKHSTVFTWLLYAPAQFLIVLSTFTGI